MRQDYLDVLVLASLRDKIFSPQGRRAIIEPLEKSFTKGDNGPRPNCASWKRSEGSLNGPSKIIKQIEEQIQAIPGT